MNEERSYWEGASYGEWLAESVRQLALDKVEDNPENCGCRGYGWLLSDFDTWYECPVHYKGQVHPEAYPDDWDTTN